MRNFNDVRRKTIYILLINYSFSRTVTTCLGSRGITFIEPWQVPTDRLEDVIGLIRPWEKATHQRNIYHRNLPLSEPKGK